MDTAALLRGYAARYETTDFLSGDPSWFMHQVEGDHDRESLAFIAAALSYGSRKQFLPKIQYILDCSKGGTFEWVKSGRYDSDIPPSDECYYRLYTKRDINRFICCMKEMFDTYGSLGDFARKSVRNSDALTVVEAFTEFFRRSGSPVIPKNTASSCKRICMFMRWMVRDDSPVDLGLWKSFIDKRTLIMPMDTHVVTEARALGLLKSGGTTMNAAKRLTQAMREVFPDDPLKGDFALFGYGIDKEGKEEEARKYITGLISS